MCSTSLRCNITAHSYSGSTIVVQRIGRSRQHCACLRMCERHNSALLWHPGEAPTLRAAYLRRVFGTREEVGDAHRFIARGEVHGANGAQDLNSDACFLADLARCGSGGLLTGRDVTLWQDPILGVAARCYQQELGLTVRVAEHHGTSMGGSVIVALSQGTVLPNFPDGTWTMKLNQVADDCRSYI
jgi:hypothetical protein